MDVHQKPELYFSPGEYLLADMAYTVTTHCMPAYKPQASKTPDNKDFNTCVANSNVRSENCIGVLKSRWGSLRLMTLQIKEKKDMKTFEKWVTSCCILYNILAELDDPWDEVLLDDEVPGYTGEKALGSKAARDFRENLKRITLETNHGSLGFGSDYLGAAPFKTLDTPATEVAIERTAVIDEAKNDDKTMSEDQVDDVDEGDRKKGEEQELEAEAIVATAANILLEDSVVEEECAEECDAQEDVKEEVEEDNKEDSKEDIEQEDEEEQVTVQEEETVDQAVRTETALEVSSSCSEETPSEEEPKAPARAAVLKSTLKPKEEPMASGIPNRPVRSGMPTHGQARGLSAASLALKKQQAAENAAAALKAMAVEIPATDSITNRIKMFGGANPNRPLGSRKLNVRDMVQKFKDVEDKNQDVIAHVAKGHNSAEPRGVCNVYSLSTASRPLRPTPRRKMSHELNEDEARDVLRSAVGRRDVEEKVGVSQESVQSVRNAKSLFEGLARAE
ncbi:unnamed protein product [Mortierella alpina]